MTGITIRVNPDAAIAVSFLRDIGAAPQYGFNTCYDLAWTKWLAHVVISAKLQTQKAVYFFNACR